MFRAGVDEAGYGPKLGPLSLGACGLDGEHALWPALAAVVGKRPGRRPLAVCDSKLLHKPGKPPRELERCALAFVALARGAVPTSLGGLLAALDADPGIALPWHDLALALPLWEPAESLATAREALREAWIGAGLPPLTVRAVVSDAPAFNRGVARDGNKASFHLGNVLGLLAGLPRPFRATVDRLGGRKRYAPALLETFGGLVQVGEESPARSRYRLSDGSEVSFEVKADREHFLVALASIVAKYVRELFVATLNAFFLARRPGLKPTAGYPTDAGRFLREIAGVLEEGERERLVRCR